MALASEDVKSRRRFTHGAVRTAIEEADPPLSKIYDMLYDRTIDFGAHPNEKAVTSNLLRETMGSEKIGYATLSGDNLMLDHAMRTCAQVGICVLKVLSLIFVDQFAKLGIKECIEKAALPF